MSLKRSDVVITRPGTMEEYKRFRATALGWGFLPEPDRRGLPPHEEMLSDVEEAHRCGVKFQGRVELDADWMGMIDYDTNFMESVVRDLEGKPVTTWWVHTYKGHPAYFFCTNAPRYRDYLMYQIKRVIASGVDWLMIDCAIPTLQSLSGFSPFSNERYGGCFCEHCMAGFRRYLGENLTSEELKAHGIEDISRFDYRTFLIKQGIDKTRYKKEIVAWPPTIPLAWEFLDYQYREISDLFLQFKRYAEDLAGRPVPMSANSPFYQPMGSYAVPALDFHTLEIEYEPLEKEMYPLEPIYVFKLSDALGRLMAATAIPPNFEPCRVKDRPGHIRLWIAQAYAFGYVFMVPVRMWTLRFKNEPDRWYYSKPGDYEELYHFIRDNADLFDDYEAIASVGLIYSNLAIRRAPAAMLNRRRRPPATPLLEACGELALLNVPFRFIVAGDDWIEDQLLSEDLSQLRAVVQFDPCHLSAEQEAKLRQVEDRLITWPEDKAKLFKLLPPQIRFDGTQSVAAVPRFKPTDEQAPAVCHLINRAYQMDSDTFAIQRDFTITLAKSLYGKTFSAATLYAPGREPLDLACRDTGNATQVTIPELDLWAVLKLE